MNCTIETKLMIEDQTIKNLHKKFASIKNELAEIVPEAIMFGHFNIKISRGNDIIIVASITVENDEVILKSDIDSSVLAKATMDDVISDVYNLLVSGEKAKCYDAIVAVLQARIFDMLNTDKESA